MSLKSVQVPKSMEPIFEQAEKYVKKYFASYQANHEAGTITISGERYILVRAKSLRVDFSRHLVKSLGLPDRMSKELGDRLLYILAKSIAREDARQFAVEQQVEDPIAKLAAGPISFNYAGWAFVKIFPESRPTPDKKYFLVYDHPYSFEADAYISSRGQKSAKPVCVMNAGYSAGWCSESFGLELEAREIMCQAKGDPACRFVMGVEEKLDQYEKWALKNLKK